MHQARQTSLRILRTMHATNGRVEGGRCTDKRCCLVPAIQMLIEIPMSIVKRLSLSQAGGAGPVSCGLVWKESKHRQRRTVARAATGGKVLGTNVDPRFQVRGGGSLIRGTCRWRGILITCRGESPSRRTRRAGRAHEQRRVCRHERERGMYICLK